MAGLGTMVNVAAIIAGGLLGLLFGSRLKPQMQEGLMKANGLAVVFIGLQGALNAMNKADDTMMLILSLALGCLLGEWLDLEKRLDQFGAWLQQKTGNGKDSQFVGAFVTASLTVCIGAMAVVGSIQDGILHDPATLYAKAILDFIIILVMTGAMGKGCIFSFIPVGLFQGLCTLLAVLIAPVFTEAALLNIRLIGSILIFCVGINLIWKRTIKVANLLPALIIAVLFAFI